MEKQNAIKLFEEKQYEHIGMKTKRKAICPVSLLYKLTHYKFAIVEAG